MLDSVASDRWKWSYIRGVEPRGKEAFIGVARMGPILLVIGCSWCV